MSKKKQSDAHSSGGSVFADLDYPPEHVRKADIVHALEDRITALGLTQTAAAARLGISQPDLSKILHGRFRGHSVDKLASYLTALDVKVSLVIEEPGSGKNKPRTITTWAPAPA